MKISVWCLTVLLTYFLCTRCFKCLSTNVTVFRCKNDQPDYFMQNKPLCRKINIKNECRPNKTYLTERHCLQKCPSQQRHLVVRKNGSQCINLFNSPGSWLNSEEKKICQWFSPWRFLSWVVYPNDKCKSFRCEKMLCTGSWKETLSSRGSPTKQYTKLTVYQLLDRETKSHPGNIIKLTATCYSTEQLRSLSWCFLMKTKGSVNCSVRYHRPSTVPRTVVTRPVVKTSVVRTSVPRTNVRTTGLMKTTVPTKVTVRNIITTTDVGDDNDVILVTVSCVGTAVAVAIIVLLICILRKRAIKKMKSTELESPISETSNPQISQPTPSTAETSAEGTGNETHPPIYEQIPDPVVPNGDEQQRYKSLQSGPKNDYQKLISHPEFPDTKAEYAYAYDHDQFRIEERNTYQPLAEDSKTSNGTYQPVIKETMFPDTKAEYAYAYDHDQFRMKKENTYQPLAEDSKTSNGTYQPVIKETMSEPIKGDDRKDNTSGQSSSYVIPAVQPERQLPPRGTTDVTDAQSSAQYLTVIA